jgi:hypothetical protein
MKFKQIIFSLFCALLVPLVAWVGGTNLDERGGPAAGTLVIAIYVFVVVYLFQEYGKIIVSNH